MPLVNRDRDGYALGTLCVIDQRPRVMSAEHREILTTLAHAVMTTMELHRAMRRVRTLALTDSLTGLPNRPALLDAVALQRRHGETFGLLYFDLDGFKAINDGMGHPAGDQALGEVARTLRTMARGEDVPARIGGDEFAMLLVKCSSSDVPGVAERMRVAIAAAMAAAHFRVTASIGAAAFVQAPDTASAALAIADRLMYAAKITSANRVACGLHPAITILAA